MEEILKVNFLSTITKENKTIKKKTDKFGYIKCLHFHNQNIKTLKLGNYFPMTLATN